MKGEPLLQHLNNAVGHLATQGLLQTFASARLLQTGLLGTEIGRSTHPDIKENPIPVVADHAPELAAIQQ
jgi:hypothetical protein